MTDIHINQIRRWKSDSDHNLLGFFQICKQNSRRLYLGGRKTTDFTVRYLEDGTVCKSPISDLLENSQVTQ